MRLSIAVRLAGVGVLGVVAVGAVAGAALNATFGQKAASARMASVSQGMSEQWNADMMHDAIRGDVMAAFVARTDAEREELGAVEIADHGPTMLDRIGRAAELAPADLKDDFAAAIPRVQAYVDLAGAIIATAATDRAAAQEQLPEFLALAEELEGSLGAVDEAMEAAVVAERDGAAAAGNRTVVTVSVAWVVASALFAVLCLLVTRAVIGPLRHIRGVLQTVSDGDFRARVRSGRQDELGDLARSVDATLESLREAFLVVETCATDITGSVDELRRQSADLTGSAAQTSGKAGEAVQLATHVSEGAQQVAAGIEQVGADP